jgi:hypothetical protein
LKKTRERELIAIEAAAAAKGKERQAILKRRVEQKVTLPPLYLSRTCFDNTCLNEVFGAGNSATNLHLSLAVLDDVNPFLFLLSFFFS